MIRTENKKGVIMGDWVERMLRKQRDREQDEGGFLGGFAARYSQPARRQCDTYGGPGNRGPQKVNLNPDEPGIWNKLTFRNQK